MHKGEIKHATSKKPHLLREFFGYSLLRQWALKASPWGLSRINFFDCKTQKTSMRVIVSISVNFDIVNNQSRSMQVLYYVSLFQAYL